MEIQQAIDFISSYPREFIPSSVFGFRVAANRRQVWGLDWGEAEISNIRLTELTMWHNSLNKKKLLFRLNNMDALDMPHILLDIHGQFLIQDGNHRVACLSILGERIAPCRVLII